MSKAPQKQKAPEKHTYVVRRDGWVAGKRAKAGDEVQLTEAEAKYEPVDPKTSKARKAAGQAAK